MDKFLELPLPEYDYKQEQRPKLEEKKKEINFEVDFDINKEEE